MNAVAAYDTRELGVFFRRLNDGRGGRETADSPERRIIRLVGQDARFRRNPAERRKTRTRIALAQTMVGLQSRTRQLHVMWSPLFRLTSPALFRCDTHQITSHAALVTLVTLSVEKVELGLTFLLYLAAN